MARKKGVKGQHPHLVLVDEVADLPPTDVDVPMFEIEELPRLEKGDLVLASTIWGDEECTVREVDLSQGLVHVVGESGDRYAISIGRVKRL